MCAEASIVWQGDRGGIDAIDPRTGEEVEIKSTKLNHDGDSLQFPTSRAITPTVISRFRTAGYWLFAVFDNYGNMAIIYRVEQAKMEAKIDLLEGKMRTRAARDEPLENNPKTTLNEIRRFCRVIYAGCDFEEFQISPGRWSIRRR